MTDLTREEQLRTSKPETHTLAASVDERSDLDILSRRRREFDTETGRRLGCHGRGLIWRVLLGCQTPPPPYACLSASPGRKLHLAGGPGGVVQRTAAALASAPALGLCTPLSTTCAPLPWDPISKAGQGGWMLHLTGPACWLAPTADATRCSRVSLWSSSGLLLLVWLLAEDCDWVVHAARLEP
jgi:hypothetical protein